MRSVSDLHDSKIFGARRAFRCECGKYSGEDHIGIICDRCGVKLIADPSTEHRRRMGHLALPVWCAHPLSGAGDLNEFPICPIGHRTESDGSPNGLGRRYERLIEVCESIRSQLPQPENSDAHIRAKVEFDRSDLDDAIAQIIGLIARDLAPDADALLPRLFHAITTLDPHASHLARSCCIALEVHTTV